jgi:hypothetical protein
VAELVARGEAELGMQQIIAILPVAGAELVGPLPAELQNVIIYAPGVSPRAPDAQAATHFLAFMRDAQAKQLMRAKGLDPASAEKRVLAAPSRNGGETTGACFRSRRRGRKCLRHRAFMPISA